MSLGRPKLTSANAETITLILESRELFKDDLNNFIIPLRTDPVFKKISVDLFEKHGIHRTFEAIYLFCTRYTSELIKKLQCNMNPVISCEV